jgi:serine/threonine-protein kinase
MLLDETTEALPLPGESWEERKLRNSAERALLGDAVPGDRFLLVRHLATGGMSEVFEAFDQAVGVSVAIKRVRSGGSHGLRSGQLEREVRLARRVAHPNVLRVFEFFPEADGSPAFLTMELLEGQTLASWLNQVGHLTPGEALPVVEELAAGLAAIHARGVVHLDLKASNVFLARQPGSPSEVRVVIGDFGVARALVEEPAADAGSATGVHFGSPHYMAPEQLTAGAVDHRTDIYALGVVLFQIVTGDLPFSGETPLDAAMRRLHEAAPHARSRVDSLPISWDRVIRDCLERDPARRPRDATAVFARLREQGSLERRRRPRLVQDRA